MILLLFLMLLCPMYLYIENFYIQTKTYIFLQYMQWLYFIFFNFNVFFYMYFFFSSNIYCKHTNIKEIIINEKYYKRGDEIFWLQWDEVRMDFISSFILLLLLYFLFLKLYWCFYLWLKKNTSNRYICNFTKTFVPILFDYIGC